MSIYSRVIRQKVTILMEPGTGLTILGTMIGSAKLIEKLLGPTAEYLGDGLKQWTQKRIENVSKIFKIAQRQLGERIEESGSVHPKVLKVILNEGSFCDDELSAEYFGGVLASSRSDISRDDRGASFLSLISRLSTYQIRSHFIFYKAIKILYNESGISLVTSEDRSKSTTFITYNSYFNAMDLGKNETQDMIVNHSMFGLQRECLIEQTFHYGNTEFLLKYKFNFGKGGIIFTPSSLGVELFLWAFGQGQLHVKDFLKNIFVFDKEGVINTPIEAIKIVN